MVKLYLNKLKPTVTLKDSNPITIITPTVYLTQTFFDFSFLISSTSQIDVLIKNSTGSLINIGTIVNGSTIYSNLIINDIYNGSSIPPGEYYVILYYYENGYVSESTSTFTLLAASTINITTPIVTLNQTPLAFTLDLTGLNSSLFIHLMDEYGNANYIDAISSATTSYSKIITSISPGVYSVFINS